MRLAVLLFLLAAVSAAPRHRPHYKRSIDKIVGGQDASAGQIPYQVSLQTTTYANIFPFCGGTVYSENYVVTAGHCVERQDARDLLVVAGGVLLYEDEKSKQTVNINKTIQHEDFNPSSFDNDIALLKLAKPFEFNKFVQPIAMPDPYQQSTGKATVSGWGILHESDDELPDHLQWVEVEVISDAQCQSEYQFINYISKSMICAASPGKDSCQADAGGPMVCNNEDGSAYLCGIVSWGMGCARPKFAGVYTEVSYFIEWLKSHAL